jgi:hypothetical protein
MPVAGQEVRMTVFGKKLSEYIAFQKVFLIVTAVVGILRLVLSLAGVSDEATRWLSMTAVGVAAMVYYGITVHTSGFGSYRQLLPLMVLQSMVAQLIAIVGIVLSAATGKANIYTANEYGGTVNPALHIAGHVVGGLIVGPLIAWAVGSLIMFVTKKVSPAPGRAPAATV